MGAPTFKVKHDKELIIDIRFLNGHPAYCDSLSAEHCPFCQSCWHLTDMHKVSSGVCA